METAPIRIHWLGSHWRGSETLRATERSKTTSDMLSQAAVKHVLCENSKIENKIRKKASESSENMKIVIQN